MNKVWLTLLMASLFISMANFVSQQNFFPLYLIPWLLGVGGFLYLYKGSLTDRLNKWQVRGFFRFILLGLLMIVTHEVFAGLSLYLYLSSTESTTNAMLSVQSSLWLNLFSLSGFVLTWYFLRKYIFYTLKEVFVLAGLFGLFLEEIYLAVFFLPIANIFYILPAMSAYALIIAPSIMSFRDYKFISMNSFWRYSLGFLLPVVASIVLVSLADSIKNLFFS